LKGPFGCGRLAYPFKMHRYYPLSGEDTIN
jgi:hypothetical protein